MGEVLVTGASGGIGSALVEALTAAGHQVASVGRRHPPGVRTIDADLSRPATLAAAVGELDALDALIHCAGIAPVDAVADTPPAAWERVYAVNVASAAELTRLALPALRRTRGQVILVNASPGMRAVPRWSAFVASKVALRELADSLRQEEAPHGVRVTTVYPAATATERLREIRSEFGRPYEPERCIQPATLASMICWVLAAPVDSYVCELAVLPR